MHKMPLAALFLTWRSLQLSVTLPPFSGSLPLVDFPYTTLFRSEEKGTTEGEMAGWHHQLNGHEFEQTPGVGDGWGGLACCSPWGRKELDMTE